MSNDPIQQDTSPPDMPPAFPEVGDKTFSSDEAGLREAAKWKREQREAAGESAIQDQHSTPVVERHLSKQAEKDLEVLTASSALRMAAKEISDQKKQEAYAAAGYSLNIDQIDAVEDHARANAEEGFQVHHPSKGHETKVGIAVGDRVVQPLEDNNPVGFHDPMNVRDATKFETEWRRVEEQRKEALLKQFADIQSEESQRQLDEARKTVEAASGPPPQQSATPAQQVPDPTAQERQRLQAQYNAIAAARQMTDVEIETRRELNAIGRWAQQSFSPAELSGDPNALAELQRTNPEKFQQLHMAGQHYGQHQNTLRQIGQTRQAQAVRAQAARQQQVDAWGADQDRQAIEAVKQDLPQFTRDDAALDKLRAATRKAMLGAGFSEQQVNQMWRSGQLRSVPVQRALARLGAHELMMQARENIEKHNKAMPPPSQRPGVFRSPASDSEADIAALERAIDRSRPGSPDQLRAAAKLLQAQRRAGRITVG